jgi:MFS family permease
MESKQSPSLFPIYLVNFIGTLGYSIVLPFLVIIVLNFGGNEWVYGLIGASYAFFQLIGAPVLGSLSDRIGRRKVLLISQAGTFLAWVVFLIALYVPESTLLEVDSGFMGAFIITIPLVLLFLSRAFDGVTGGNVSVANAYLADVTDEDNRTLNFGRMAISGNLGFIIGPVLAGLLGSTSLGYLLPVALALLISLAAIFVIFFQLKEYDPCKLHTGADPDKTRKLFGQEHKECHKLEGNDHYSIKGLLNLKNVKGLILTYFLIFLAFNFFYVAFPIHAVNGLEWDIFTLGLFFSVSGIVMVVFQGPVLTWVSKRISEPNLVLLGGAILSIGFLLFSSDNMAILFSGVVLFSVGNGLMWPSFLSILSKATDQQYQGALQGFASSVGSLASIIGLLLGGIIYQQVQGYIFIIPAIIVGIICIVLLVKPINVTK